MKANELMIDDWVYNKNIDKPMQVYPVMFSQMFRSNPNAITEDYNIFPVPLTPEILEQNLATEHQISWCIGWDRKDDIHVEIKRENLHAAFYGVIDFVHELQHALRLCGIEKEIEL